MGAPPNTQADITKRRTKVIDKRYKKGKPIGTIASELGVSSETIKRDLRAIAEKEFSKELDKEAKEIMAHFSRSTQEAIQTAAEIMHDEDASKQDRLRASKQLVEFQKDKIEKMQELGFAPKAPEKIQHSGSNVKFTFEDPEEVRKEKEEEQLADDPTGKSSKTSKEDKDQEE